MGKITLKDYEKRHNIKYIGFPIKVIKQIGNSIYFSTEFGICKKAASTFGRNNYTIRSATDKTEFLKNKLISLYGHLYDYKNMIFGQKINIECKIHGEFIQCFKAHIRGQGCPKCSVEIRNKENSENSTGWSITNWIKASENNKFFDAFKIYIIECWNDEEHFYKIGRTFFKVSRRFNSNRKMPYKYKIIQEFKGTAKYIFKLEAKLKFKNKNNSYSPKEHFNGHKECFSKIND